MLAGLLCGWIGFSGLASQLPAQQPASQNSLAALQAIEESAVSAIERSGQSVVAISRVPLNENPAARARALQLNPSIAGEESAENIDFVPQFFGSGVILSEDGLIVTCAHVLDDPRANQYYVWLDKRSYRAEVVGKPAKVLASDPFSDLAVLKIEASGLQPAKLVEDFDLKRGQFVVALGNPQATARDGQATASFGIVANLKRVAPKSPGSDEVSRDSIHEMGTLIQTDAKLGIGSSGGGLFNLKGELVGLTTNLVASSGYEEAAGFAIAADSLFLRVIDSLKAGELPEYGFLGVQPENVSGPGQGRGARVSMVIPGLPGDEAGLQPRDVIVEVDGAPIANRNDLFRELSGSAAGSRVKLVVQRQQPGMRIPNIVTHEATLSKKYVAAHRSAYAINSQQPWRGMLVEYSTAVPAEVLNAGINRGRGSGPKVTILEVTPGTPAWEAGLRPGYGIVSIADRRIARPSEFYEVAEDEQDSRVDIVATDSSGRIVNAEVKPPDAE